MADETLERVGSLLDFLAAYNARRNPPVHDIAKYGLEVFRQADIPQNRYVALTPGADQWLNVSFVDLPAAPPVPATLVNFINGGRPIQPSVRPQIVDPDGEPPREPSARMASEWVEAQWVPWSVRYAEAAAVKRLYRRLFEVRDRVTNDRDGLELVWGFGRLRWEVDTTEKVDHPILTIPVEVDVSSTGTIHVRPAGAVTVESLYLSDLPMDDRAGFNAVRQSLDAQEDIADPWDAPTLVELATKVVRSVAHSGRYADAGDINAAVGSPVADGSWVLFLRRRQPDYQGFLDAMRDLYKNGVAVPTPLKSIVVDEPSKLLFEHRAGLSAAHGNDPLLLPLPTNEEQQRIVTYAQTRPGVTVQGPPGTGKSHTIANIISHYVAYGKRVLVVAEKEQALSVLADKVPSGIRDLTVSVLGADDEGRRRLESSVSKIQTRVTGLDPQWADQQIDRLTKELDRIDREVATLTDRLLKSRSVEADQIQGRWAGMDNPTVSQAAQWVAKNASEFGYIVDHVPLDRRCPLNADDLADLVDLLKSVGLKVAQSAGLSLPPLDAIPNAQVLAEKFARLDAFEQRRRAAQPELADLTLVDRANGEVMRALKHEVDELHTVVMAVDAPWKAAVIESLKDARLAAEWEPFLDQVVADREELLSLGAQLEAHVVTVPENDNPAFTAMVQQAHDRLKDKGKLGLFAGDAKKALAQMSIDGRQPASADDLRICLLALKRNATRQRLCTRWANRMERVQGPTLDGVRPEDVVGPLVSWLRTAAESPTRWQRLRGGLASVGISAPQEMTQATLSRLAEVVAVADHRVHERQAVAEIAEISNALVAGQRQQDASPIWGRLKAHLEERDVEKWEACRQEAEALERIRPQARRLRTLHDQLRAAAPVWTGWIVDDPRAAGNPVSFEMAWQWRQLEGWVQSIAKREDPAVLQRQLEALTGDRRRVVSELVSERAWRRLAATIGDRERAALNRYLIAVRRYGKTGGKYAARWLQEIRSALNDAKDAVPVWIMTTSRALSSFRPGQTPPFDVLIVDEASQISFEALPILSLAKTTIVVGDDKQTSPEAVGVDQQQFFNLQAEYLQSIPHHRTLLAPATSLYDLAFQKFPSEIMLTEHFRCLPDIIQFSNQHVYDNRIIPLRDQPPAAGWKPVGAVRVTDGYRQGDINLPEAEVVVSLVAEMCEDPAYDGMDFGVVSLLGSSQSKLIWEKLFERLGPQTMTERSIRCGEPANFQGDERDVIVLSTVVAVDPNVPAARIGAMTKESDLRRINVAASRAREQLWIVHSVDPDRFPNGDLRGALIRHCQNPTELAGEYERLEERCESQFERDVLQRILRRGYRRVRAQQEVGRYRIDLVVEGPESRVAVECDGDRWHGPDVWHKDRSRQQVLERAGWTFERIRGSAFYRDPEAAMEPLWERLEAMSIPIGDDWVGSSDKSSVRTVASVDLAPPPPPLATQSNVALAASAVEEAIAKVRPPAAQPKPAVGAERLPSAPSPTSPASPSATGTSGVEVELLEYSEWEPRALIEPAYATRDQLLEGLVEIVTAEGPMHALRAYQLYVKASGGHRVGKESRTILNKALAQAIREGRLAQIKDSIVGQAEKTVYLPDTPPMVLRTLGPRSLVDVPRSELKGIIMRVRAAQPIDLHRQVLDTLGLTKRTERAVAYIDECLDYAWDS